MSAISDRVAHRQAPASVRAGAIRSSLYIVAALSLLGAAGCGPSQQLTGASLCRDYLALPIDERSDAAFRISSEVRAKDAGNPMWALNLDYNCSHSPNKTIRSAFGK